MLKNYLTIAWRNLKRNRVYTFLNVFGLSLGLACGLLVFWFIRFHTTHDDFHPNIDRVVGITTEFHFDGVSHSRGVPPAMWRAVSTESSALAYSMCIESYGALMAVLDENDRPVKKFRENDGGPKLAFVQAGFFSLFSYDWKMGTAAVLKKPNVIVLTERMAEKYFGEEDPIGRIIKLENELKLEVAGIISNPRDNSDLGYEFLVSFETLLTNKDFVYGGPPIDTWTGVNSNTYCYALLPKNFSIQKYNKELQAINEKYHGKDWKSYRHKATYFREFHHSETYYGPVPYKWLYIMAVIGIFLIITACFNFVNMATAQALRRAKEVGIRKAIGGMQGQVLVQFLIETAMITFFALVAGFVIASLLLPKINDWLELVSGWPRQLPLADPMQWLFLLALFTAVVLLSGFYPGMILAGFRPIVALKGSMSQKHVGGINVRKGLIVLQFALIQVLIICTLVVNNQVEFMLNKSVGYETQGIVEIPIPTPDKINQETFRNRILNIPGIENASMCLFMPTANSNNTTSCRYDTRQKDEVWQINTKNADHHYIETFGLEIIAGKNIPRSDTTMGYLINEAVVEKLGLESPEEAVGKNIKVWNTAPIYGVIKNWNNRSFENEIEPIAIFTAKDIHYSCAIRLKSQNLNATMKEVEKVWNSYFPDFLYEQTFLDEAISNNYQFVKTLLKLIRFFSIIAIFIGCLGLYGLVKFMAAQKSKEIGVRKVLGATVSQILGLFGKEIIILVLVGFVIAAPLGWYLMDGWLKDYTYRISIGTGIMLAAIGLTALVAIITSLNESLRAAWTNPTKSLKSE
jgi:putative ABC transport system permease protein